jgi:hypothetical protein
MSVSLTVAKDVGWSLGPGRGYVAFVEFSWEGESRGTTDVLNALLSHPRYADDFLTQDSERNSIPDTHGPYQLGRLAPHNFVPTSVGEAVGKLRRFVNAAKPDVGSEAAGRVLAEIDELERRNGQAFELSGESPPPRHELGWIIKQFLEFVLIRTESRGVLLVVAVVD